MISSRADRAHAFARFGFEADLVRVQVEDAGDAVADGVLVVGQLRPLGVDDAVEVDNAVPGFGNLARPPPRASRPSRGRGWPGRCSGNRRPMSGRAAAPSRASVTACSSTSASLWPTRCRSCGTSMPPSRSGPPGAVRCESSPSPMRRLLVAVSPGAMRNWRSARIIPGRQKSRQRERS